MPSPLPIYLHDHLGAANFAIELLETWARGKPASLSGLASWAKPLLEEISTDRETLRQIVTRIGDAPSSLKEMFGSLAEKAARHKLANQEPPEFAHFEGLELLAIGILGKLTLWETLQLLAPDDPRLQAFDYPTLIARARAQHANVEARRRAFARTALTHPSSR